MNPIVISGLILGMSMAWAQAGPCTSEISKIEQAVNEPNSMYAPTARQTVGAQLNRQPTPESIARAEQKADAHYDQVLSKAKSLDAANNPDCENAVKELKLLIGMQ
jgi:hypothetical protein